MGAVVHVWFLFVRPVMQYRNWTSKSVAKTRRYINKPSRLRLPTICALNLYNSVLDDRQ